ncbi:MAG: histidine--tRNA ligase, partial [Proteobacteria bacterium]|nr:histidine--tRNA ligase [Pseudomonadota bacterium]
MLSHISGFPEFLPHEQLAFNRIVEIIRNKFELYGFSPLDTPAVEKTSTLLAKGSDHEIYGLYRLSGDEGTSKKDLALRFDLTVPLARYVAQHHGRLTFPYRRYHIAPVWRGERPQAGRYRQFYQCDIDIIGEGELSLTHDGEVLSVIYEIFNAIGLQRFIIKINNRSILTSLIKDFGIAEDNVANVLRIIDKAEKISKDQWKAELSAQGLKSSDILFLMNLLSMSMSNKEWLTYLKTLSRSSEFITGIEELEQVLEGAQRFGVPDDYIQITPSLARGLSYYTGTVYETKLLDYPELGSVCGGGRYGNLTQTFINKKFPGVGISIGISRLISKLIEIGLVKTNSQTPASILVTTQNRNLMTYYID